MVIQDCKDQKAITDVLELMENLDWPAFLVQKVVVDPCAICKCAVVICCVTIVTKSYADEVVDLELGHVLGRSSLTGFSLISLQLFHSQSISGMRVLSSCCTLHCTHFFLPLRGFRAESAAECLC